MLRSPPIQYFVFEILVTLVGYSAWIGIKYQRGRKAREELEVFAMIEKILELLYLHYESSK